MNWNSPNKKIQRLFITLVLMMMMMILLFASSSSECEIIRFAEQKWRRCEDFLKVVWFRFV